MNNSVANSFVFNQKKIRGFHETDSHAAVMFSTVTSNVVDLIERITKGTKIRVEIKR